MPYFKTCLVPLTVADQPDRTGRLARLVCPKDGAEGSVVVAVLPWLGVPVLLSAALAETGNPLPGEFLPVLAFLPLVGFAYVAAVVAPVRWRAATIGLPGWLAVIGLLAYVGLDSGQGVQRTLLVSFAAAALCAGTTAGFGRAMRRAAPLATAAGTAMVFSQGLDGWLTYLAVANPYGWLPQAVTERVLVSRLILDAVPVLYPLLKLGIAVIASLALGRQSVRAGTFVPAALVVCYLGMSPAMFSAANLLASA